MDKPNDLTDITTWTDAQKAWAAPKIIFRASTAIDDLNASIFSANMARDLESAVGFAKIRNRYQDALTYWKAYASGSPIALPRSMKKIRVSSYEQTNKRVRPAKTINGKDKSWGVWG